MVAMVQQKKPDRVPCSPCSMIDPRKPDGRLFLKPQTTHLGVSGYGLRKLWILMTVGIRPVHKAFLSRGPC